jgi:MoaA/NifB/PqqE/SkfB family radical SAM enzyme
MRLRALAQSMMPAIPSSLWTSARLGASILQAPYYYLPYVFGSGRARKPLTIMMEVTYRCNLTCIMCPLVRGGLTAGHPESRDHELSLSEITKVFNDAAAMGVENVTLTGGEFLLRRDACDIVRAAKRFRLAVAVITNATLMNEEKAKNLVEGGLDALTVSIDGAASIHDAIRGPNAFERSARALRAIAEVKRLRNSKTPSLRLSCTIFAVNASQLTAVVDLAGEVGATAQFAFAYYKTDEMLASEGPRGAALHVKGEDQRIPLELRNVDQQQLSRELDLILDRARARRVVTRVRPNVRGSMIDRWFRDDSFNFVNKCFYPWYTMRISPSGTVYPCSLSVPLGDVRAKSLGDIWNGQEYVAFRRELKAKRLFGQCTKCCALHDQLWNYLPAV